MLGGHVLVGERGSLRIGLLQDPAGGRGQVQLLGRPAVHLGGPLEDLFDPVAKQARRLPELLEEGVHHAFGVGQQGEQDVSRLDHLVVASAGQLLGRLDGLL